MQLYFSGFLTLLTLVSVNSCRILALSGGGSHGAFEAGVVAKLVDSGLAWNHYTGISAGGLNAAFLASYEKNNMHQAANDLAQLWINLNSSMVYQLNSDIWQHPLSVNSILSNAPLNDTIQTMMANRNLKQNVSIGMSNVGTGDLEIYRLDLLSGGVINLANHLLASAAIPIAFAPVQLYDSLYYDGGLISDIFFNTDLCASNNHNLINVDVIMSSGGVEQLTLAEQESYHIISLAERVLNIVNTNYFSQMLNDPSVLPPNLNITIYYPEKPLPVGLMDFSAGQLQWAIGYNSAAYKNIIT